MASSRSQSAPGHSVVVEIRQYVTRRLNVISLLQFCTCFLFLLMFKLVSIALHDLFGPKSPFLKMIRAQRAYGLPFMPTKTKALKYATDDLTRTQLDTRYMCQDAGQFDALMIVHSAGGHFEHRQNYRDTYGDFEFTRPYKIKIVFFLGLPTDPDLQVDIVRENTESGDTVQGNFIDTYRNLTYKAVTAYRWVAENCWGTKVILKMDDDVILDVHRFFEEFWFPPVYQREIIFCHVWKLGEVERTGKWGISLDEYRLEYYPPYCSGFIVVLMPSIVEDLYYTARSTPFLWLDDVFIYGVVREEMRDVQIINVDQVAYREEHYTACYRQYGYRCKYWATVLPVGQAFISTIMALRADRLRDLDHEKTKRGKPTNRTSMDVYINNNGAISL